MFSVYLLDPYWNVLFSLFLSFGTNVLFFQRRLLLGRKTLPLGIEGLFPPTGIATDGSNESLTKPFLLYKWNVIIKLSNVLLKLPFLKKCNWCNCFITLWLLWLVHYIFYGLYIFTATFHQIFCSIIDVSHVGRWWGTENGLI